MRAQSAPLAVNAAHSVGASTALKMAAVQRDAARAPDACCDSDADDETIEAVEYSAQSTQWEIFDSYVEEVEKQVRKACCKGAED